MPQATPELRAEFADDSAALDTIAINFRVDRGGMIRRKDGLYAPTDLEFRAIDYLFQEWDYAYEG